jgi:hypothetical protein
MRDEDDFEEFNLNELADKLGLEAREEQAGTLRGSTDQRLVAAHGDDRTATVHPESSPDARAGADEKTRSLHEATDQSGKLFLYAVAAGFSVMVVALSVSPGANDLAVYVITVATVFAAGIFIELQAKRL